MSDWNNPAVQIFYLSCFSVLCSLIYSGCKTVITVQTVACAHMCCQMKPMETVWDLLAMVWQKNFMLMGKDTHGWILPFFQREATFVTPYLCSCAQDPFWERVSVYAGKKFLPAEQLFFLSLSEYTQVIWSVSYRVASPACVFILLNI